MRIVTMDIHVLLRRELTLGFGYGVTLLPVLGNAELDSEIG
jgi:hypothetical protein